MKNIFKLTFLAGMLFSLVAFADTIERVIITGEPYAIEQEGDAFVVNSDINENSDYYYFNVKGSRRVCYREERPTLTKVNLGVFKVRLRTGTEVTLHCYRYTPDYFIIR